MKVHIAIDTRTFVRFCLVVIGFALFFLAIYRARVALTIIGTAFFLALALNAPVSRLARHLPGRSRVLSTAIAYVAVVAFLALFIFLVVPPIIDQSVKLANSLPHIIDTVTTQWHGVDQFIRRYHLEQQVDTTVQSIKHNISTWASGIGPSLINGIGSFAGMMTSMFLVLVLTFLMLIEGPEWLKRLWGIYQDNEQMEYHRNLAHRMYSVVTGYVTGQLVVSALDGLFAGLVVFVLSLFLGVPSDLALPAVAILFLFSLIPMFGATIGGALITLLLAFNDATAAVIFVVYFIIYQQIENNLIAPTIQSRRLELSPLAVLVAVTIGLYVFGIAGGIISIPIAGCIKVLVEDYLSRARQKRKQNDRPLAKFVKKVQRSTEV